MHVHYDAGFIEMSEFRVYEVLGEVRVLSWICIGARTSIFNTIRQSADIPFRHP
jgi:hypothetical protein